MTATVTPIPWLCRCTKKNAGRAQFCPACGERRPELSSPGQPAQRKRGTVCPYDGAVLRDDGFCPDGDGYPYGLPCPFVCPVCRQRLEWAGGCRACHGALHGSREEWKFPGDRYDLFDDAGQPLGDGQHWRLVRPGPAPAISVEENKEVLTIVQRMLARGQLGQPLPVETP